MHFLSRNPRNPCDEVKARARLERAVTTHAPLTGRRPGARAAFAAFAAALVMGCSQMPTIGPTAAEIAEATSPQRAAGLQVVDVNDAVARRLLAQRRLKPFAEVLSTSTAPTGLVGQGDTVEVTIWEAPPATLFASGTPDPRAPSSSRAFTLPEQVVDREGAISVPFAGRIRAAGLSPQAVEAEIVRKLKGKANQPEVLVRVVRNASANVTVVGEVTNSLRMPLTSAEERLLDALAAAGGVRQPVNKMTIQVSRGGKYHALPLDMVIRDPRQNLALQAGDVVTAIFQPLSFTALGSTGKNEEINFEAQGITLAQALARAGGLVDARSNPEGVFIFRFESPDALDWPNQPVAVTPEGQVPVVYRVDLRNPSNFFVIQSFPISHKDVLYVANSPSAELQKFLNLVFSITYPVLNTIQLTR